MNLVDFSDRSLGLLIQDFAVRFRKVPDDLVNFQLHERTADESKVGVNFIDSIYFIAT
jgi:hypothetical protein